MKKKIILGLIIYILIKVFLNYQNIQKNIYITCLLFFKKIFPPLFIFFIISSLLINYGFIDLLTKYFSKLFYHLFHINIYSTYVFIMSMISGIPSSAKYINDLIDEKKMSEYGGAKILLFTHFANPLFIMSIYPSRPYLILFAHFLPNFIIALFLRGYNKEEYNNYIIHNESKPFMKLISDSIYNSINTLFNILGIIIIFYTLSNLTNIFFIKYILEMTCSIIYLNSLNVNLKLKTMLIGGILSFGGLSCHTQVMSILNNKKIRYSPYLLARLTHFMLSTMIIYLLY